MSKLIPIISVDAKTIYDYIDKFNRDNGTDENAVKTVFEKFEDNDYTSVLIKVIVLNQLYSTRLDSNSSNNNNVDIRSMAEYISENKTKFKCKTINDVIKLVEESKKYFDNKKMNFPYSFITKYCSWSFPSIDIPIVDSYAKGMIYYLNKQQEFYNSFTQKELNNYSEYCIIYECLFKKIKKDIPNMSYKNLDKYLWKYGTDKVIRI